MYAGGKIAKPRGWYPDPQPERAHKIAPELLQAIPRVSPACSDCSLTETRNQRKDESVADCKALLEALFLWHSGVHTINKVTQSAPAALFVNGLSSEISGLLKRQKIGWEAISLTEHMTILSILKEPWSKISNKSPAKIIALQLRQPQGQRSKIT